MDIGFSKFSEGFKDGRPEGLLNEIFMGSEDGIVLGYLVGALVGASVGSSG